MENGSILLNEAGDVVTKDMSKAALSQLRQTELIFHLKSNGENIGFKNPMFAVLLNMDQACS